MKDRTLDANPWIAREKPELLGLLRLPGMTAGRLREMLALFGSPGGAWEAVLHGAGDRSGTVAGEWRAVAGSIDVSAALAEMETRGISVVVRGESSYPGILAQIHDPPTAIFVRGILPRNPAGIAIVGSRKATPYGLEAARWLAEGLAAEGACVVSGAASGIDTAAHAGALDSGGPTVAVLGCGVDVVYPRSNARLYERIKENGALLSEYFPGTEPRPFHFPARNRIIAGLSRAVIVVEASEKSGALITADFALAEGRDVMAVPGQVFSANSKGTHILIRSGAALVASPNDVLAELGLEPGRTVSSDTCDREDLPPDEKSLLEALRGGALGVDSLSLAVGLPAGRTLATLGSLEVRGLVSRAPGGSYQRCRPR
ncbi:MAG: DNA-processing protein DprA [Candidatus Geothermincolia bacterium]